MPTRKRVFFHYDAFSSPDKLLTEINRVGQSRNIFVYYRHEVESSIKKVVETLLAGEVNRQFILLDKHVNSIYITLTNIELYAANQTPSTLLHHPDEQQFNAVQRIEQIIDIKDRISRGYAAERYIEPCIFDRLSWTFIPRNELKIFASSL